MSEVALERPQPIALETPEELNFLTPRQLAWRRFKRHRLALISAVVLIVMYLVTGFAEFFAPYATTSPLTRHP